MQSPPGTGGSDGKSSSDGDQGASAADSGGKIEDGGEGGWFDGIDIDVF